MQEANKYPSNLEGWLLLEKLKEKEALKKSQMEIEEVDQLEYSFEIEKNPIDYMES